MEASTSSGGLARRQEQGEEVDFEALKLVKTNHDVHVRVSEKVDLEGLPAACNLMAVSNTWGILVVGGNNDVRIHRLDDLHRLLEESPKDASPTLTPVAVLTTPGRPIWIRLAVNDEKLVVATSNPNSIQLYHLKDLVSGNTNAYHSVTTGLPERIIDILSNPAAPTSSENLARIIALVTGDGLVMLDAESGRIAESVKAKLTCASWSPKGKQIVCGDRTGKLVQYTPEGAAKAEILPPPELQEGSYPTSVEWVENDTFLVAYKNADADEDEPLSVFTIHRNKAASEMVYHEFFDPINTIGLPTRSGSHRFVATLKPWGDATRRLALMISGRSSEVGIMRMINATDKPTPVWETLMLDETARGVMPAGKSGVSEDTSCIGLELDLTSRKPIVMGIVGGVEVPDLAPAPRLLAYSQEGFIVCFDLQYPEAGEYLHMVIPKDVLSTTTSDSKTTNDEASTPAKPAPPSETKPAFGGFGSQPSAFGSASTTTGFGAKPASPSSSGSGQSAFGQPSSSGFGQSAFGQPSTPHAKFQSAFGQSSTTPAFGSSAFGSSTTPASTPSSTSAFGKPATSAAFGQSAFGSTASSGGFGQSAFGQKSSTQASGFGQSAFGSGSLSSSSSAFGAKATTPSATPASTSAFGQPAFGQKTAAQTSTPSAFGQTAFGQPSKPSGSAFGQPAAAPSSSPFSSTPAPASTGGFAGFGQKPAGQTGFGFGGSAFGQKMPSACSGSSPFGSGVAVKSGSAFGSSSGFGQSPFGSKPATPPTPTSPSIEKPTAQPSSSGSGGFGLGGLGSALENTKPSQIDSQGGSATPAGSQPSSTQTSQTTPPDSPVFGASRGLSGQDDNDDDSPPPTPKPTSTTPAKPVPASTTNSFIKPATAFGSASSFGSFVAPATPAQAPLSSSTTPNAFSKPVSAFTTTPSAGTASGAFGVPAFGASSFGKSSTPSGSAFGKSSAPPAVGNITGGFGGFAAKKTDSPSGSAFSGFGGGGGPTGKSAFGTASGGSSFSALLSGEKPKEAVKSSAIEADKSKTTEVKGERSTTPPTPAQEAPTPTTASKDITTTPPTPSSIVKEEVKTPDSEVEPKGYDVPEPAPAVTTTPAKAVPPVQQSTSPSPEPVTRTQQVDEPVTDKDQVDQKPDIEELERQAGSSPEIIELADADREQEEGDEEDHHDEEYDEDDEQYDEEGEDEESYEGEGEYDDEEYDEGDYEEGDEQEEEDEGEEDEEDEDEDEEGPDSPQSEETANPPSQTQPTASLFSRLAPPPSSGNPFMNKHAVRTSSPLSSHPPQYANAEAETSTPPGTPPTAPAVKATKDASDAAPPPFFGFKSDIATKTSSPIPAVAPATTTQDHGPPSLFGKPQAGPGSSIGLGKSSLAPSQPESKAPFSFGLGKPSGTPATSSSEPPKTSLFGNPITAPSTASTTAPKLPFSFGGSAPSPVSGGTPSSDVKPASLFGQPASLAPPATVSTPVKPPTASMANTGKFATPARTPVKDSPQAKDDGSRQMAAVMSRMITDLMSEIKTMREALDAHAEYHRGLEPRFNKVSIDDLDSHSDLPFSTLNDIAAVIDQLTAEMTGITQKDQKMEHRVLEVQSRMVKTDMKTKQAEKLIEAHEDVNLAYHTDPQTLGLAQTDERASLRRRKQAAESKLDDLERSVQRLKKAAAEGQPTIDKLHQSIKEVESGIIDKQDLIEDLSMRVKSIRLSTPGARRSLGPRQSISMGARPKPTVFQIPSDVTTQVERGLDQLEKKPTFTAKVARATRVGKSVSTVSVGTLGMPGKIDISTFIREDKKDVTIKEEPESDSIVPHANDQRPKPGSSSSPVDAKSNSPPAGNMAPPPSFPSPFNLAPAPTSGPGGSLGSPNSAFGGIKLSLDPGDLSSAHTRSRTAVSGSSRAHHAAPRLSASPSPSPASGSGSSVSGPPAISFFAPPKSDGAPNQVSGKAGPKGFVSFSGFGQK